MLKEKEKEETETKRITKLLLKIADEKGINFYDMPKEEISKWVSFVISPTLTLKVK